MAQLWKSFVEALAPPQRGEQPRREGVTLNCTVGERSLSRREPPSNQAEGPSSRAPPEYREVMRSDLNIVPARDTQSARVAEVDLDSDVEFQDSREVLPTRSLADSIAVPRVPQATTSETMQPSSTGFVEHHTEQSESGGSLQVLNSEEGVGASNAASLIEDVRYFQNAALGYQDAYEALQLQQEELQTRFTQQAQLVQEASEALRAAEVESSVHKQEIVALQSQQDVDIQRAIDQAVSQYQDQLSSMQSNLQWKDKEHQQSIQRLQDQVRVLELSLAGQATLPSVAASSSKACLHQEVFNILPGTVNPHRGAAQYESQDQAFSFHKQVRFEDNNSSPELRPDMKSGGGRSSLVLPVITPRLSNISSIPHAPKYSSTPHRAVPSNRTFDVGTNAPLVDDSRNTATIAAEVSAAAAVQASKEFHRMREPKITKLRGGYSADTELMFRSWKSDILAHINDRELDNKAAIQLIKEQTLDNARRKVEFQLDLCCGDIT